MRIAFASEENNGLESMLSPHFGRCPYYIFVDIEGNEVKDIKVKENPFFNKHEPGVVPNFIAEQKADVIIAGGMGPRAMEWFGRLGVNPKTTSPQKIKQILKDYLEGKLIEAKPCK